MTGVSIGTPFTSSATKVVLLGSGELGKEVRIWQENLATECLIVCNILFFLPQVVIELQRLGCEVTAVDVWNPLAPQSFLLRLPIF
jgi:formate-dependent phosphoribosylglycinamide formyltransferase (GAR transformylase)